MMNLAVAEAVYIGPALYSPLWYEMGSFWYLIRLGLGYEIWYEMVRDQPLWYEMGFLFVRDSPLWYDIGSFWYPIHLGLGYDIWNEMVRDFPCRHRATT